MSLPTTGTLQSHIAARHPARAAAGPEGAKECEREASACASADKPADSLTKCLTCGVPP